MLGRSRDVEQRIIDHEVRMSRAREAVAVFRGLREGRASRRVDAAEQDWLREEIVLILRSAATEQELEALGLSDEVIHETGLGDSLLLAWRSLRLPPGNPDGILPRATGHAHPAG